MKSLMMTYRVKAGEVEKVKGIVKDFVTAVKQREPETLVYESYQLKEGLEFVHFMKFQSGEGGDFHKNTEWFEKFARILHTLCERKLKFIELDSFY